MVVVDGRIRHPRLQLRVGALELLDELVDCRHAAYLSVADSVTSGMPASAFETGQLAFAPSACSASGRVDTGDLRLDDDGSLDDPFTWLEGHGHGGLELVGCVPAWASPCESAIE